MADPFLPPPWLDTEGRREGRYVLGPLLGKGGMGEVFEAWDLVLARPVALKILRHLEPAAMIRFMHEAQLHARMDLPGICRIYDVDASNGSPRIAMQLVRGPTLEDAAPELTLEEIVSLLAQVADTIHAAHQLRLIHRDLKPSNILLQWQEGGWTPYICDFGLAMAVDGPSVTQPLAMTGTPAYMAPEQVRGDRSLTCPATDVYGIGSTLYFALTGRPPCVSTVSSEVLLVKRNARFPSPRSLEPEIPADLERILLKCLQPAPEDRYPAAADLAADLRRFLSGEALAGPEPPPENRLPGWLRRNWAPLAGALVVAAAAAGLYAIDRAGQRSQVRSTVQTQILALESANLEQLLRNERLLPVHDLRPAYARTRARMEALRQRLGVLGAEAEGPVRYALGRANYFMGDYPAAQAEMEKAWKLSYRTPDAAFLLAQIRGRAARAARAEANFQVQAPPPACAQLLAEAEAFLGQAKGLSSDPPEFVEAFAWAMRDNPAQALEHARASLRANPWHQESAVLEVLSHCALAEAQSDPAEAGRQYQAALGAAEAALVRGPSFEPLYHVWLKAAFGQAGLGLERGDLDLKALEPLARRAEQALLLDPEQQGGQSDWLRVRYLRAARLLDLGQDPRPILDEALQFYWSRTREPRSLALRTDHMLLYGLLAQRDHDRGEDPGPALTEALKGAGQARDWPRDGFGELLTLKARLEAARGQDPRPTVEALLQHAGASPDPGGSRLETAAEACLIRARWEQGHGLEPRASLGRAQDLLERALRARPGSGSAHGLLGQAQVLEARLDPGRRASLLSRAQEQLKLSRKHAPTGRQVAELRALLAGRST